MFQGAAHRVLVLFICFAAVGCARHNNPEAGLSPRPDAPAVRQMQTRYFETENEAELLSASAALLQDLGFLLDETSSELGLVVASKARDAKNEVGYGERVFIDILMSKLAGKKFELEEKIRTSIVTRKASGRDGYEVRVTMQRVLVGHTFPRRELITDPVLYREFFARLSKSVFLEAHEI